MGRFIRAGLLVSLAVLVAASVATAADLPDEESLPNGRFFRQTGQETGNGFAVTDDGGIPFWTEFQKFNLDEIGYPISNRFDFKGFTTQAFQKAILQWDPGRRAFNFLNILDEMHLAGKDPALTLIRQTPPHAALPGDAQHDPTTPAGFEAIQQNHLRLLDQNPTIRTRFLSESNWLDLYGLPISYAVYGPVQVLRAQRQVFQVWTEAGGGGPKGVAVLANTGDLMKEFGVITGAAVTPISVEQARTGVPVTTVTAAPVSTSVATPTPTAVQTVAPTATPAPTVTPLPTVSSGPAPAPLNLPQGLRGYGMQAHMVDDDRADEVVGKIVEAGFNWTKQQVRWEEIETQRGVFNWGKYDNALNAPSRRGIKLMASVVAAPAWARAPGTTHGPPANVADIKPFLTALMQRYKGRIHAVEVWNEANLNHEWGFLAPNAIRKYGEMLKAGYEAVKSVDPSVVVIFGAPTPTGVNDPNIAIDDATYVRRVYEEFPEVKNYFDALGIHPNGGPNHPDDTLGGRNRSVWGWTSHPSFFFNRFAELKAIMTSKGDPNKTIWFTEFGWSSTPVTQIVTGYEYSQYNSEQDQADFLVRAFQKVRAEFPYVTHMFIWNLNFQQVVGPADEKYGFGILRPDGSGRPAYHALRAMPK